MLKPYFLLYLQRKQLKVMLANNIWKLTGELFEWAFAPFKALRLGTNDSWWASNMVSFILMAVGVVMFIYWMGLMRGYKKNGTEDVA